MAEAPLASAVIVPDLTEDQLPSSPTTLKRRQSSFLEDKAKRPRLSHDSSDSKRRRDSAASPPDTPIDAQSERRRSGQLEERKRGQRLFGALLGTLSQSSSSTAQKRRTDIEKKQQAKLKQQAEEQDEKKKQKREALMVIRRREQKKYDKQSMHIRHSNMLAQAHFLHTKAEPKLYYKPWELLPSEEERIKAQVEETEAIIEKEREQWEAENPADEQQVPPDSDSKTEPPEMKETTNGQTETVGDSTNNEEGEPPGTKAEGDTNMNGTASPGDERKTTEPAEAEPAEAAKDHDDGGEVVEGEEDTVIY